MANPQPSPSDGGIADDFFEQIFAYGAGAGAGAGAGGVGGAGSVVGASGDGVLGGGEDGGFSGMALQLNSREGAIGGRVGCGAGDGNGSGAFLGTTVFPLGLSLDHGGGTGAYGKVDDVSSSGSGKRFRGNAAESGKAGSAKAELAPLFPSYGHLQTPGHLQTQPLRPNPPQQQFHGQPNPGPVPIAQHPPAPRPRVRARRGQATDPHSIAERLRRERIAERMRALQELVPSSNKTDRAAMLDEIVDYVKFLRLQVKVLSMSRLGAAGAVAQLVADFSLPSAEGSNSEGGVNQQVWEKWSSDGTEHQVAKLMEEDVGAAMQFLQSKALCIMPISLAATIYQPQNQQETPPHIKPEPSAPS